MALLLGGDKTGNPKMARGIPADCRSVVDDHLKQIEGESRLPPG